MKYQFFAQGTSALKAELKKEEKKYMAAVNRNAGTPELASLKERIIMLHTQLCRAVNGYARQ